MFRKLEGRLEGKDELREWQLKERETSFRKKQINFLFSVLENKNYFQKKIKKQFKILEE